MTAYNPWNYTTLTNFTFLELTGDGDVSGLCQSDEERKILFGQTAKSLRERRG
jgi:hypothetical protein